MHAGPSEHPTPSPTVDSSRREELRVKATPAGRMDGLGNKNTAGKVWALERKAQRHLSGKEWFVPMSWNDHSYVTEGKTEPGTQ